MLPVYPCGSPSDLLADAHGRQVGIFGQQFLDPLSSTGPAGWHARAAWLCGGCCSWPGRRPRCDASSAVAARWPGRRVSRSPPGGGSRPTRRRSWRVPPRLGSGRPPAWRNNSPSRISPWPGSGRRLTPGSRQRQHLHQRQLVGDQIAVEQFLPGLCHGRRRQAQVGCSGCGRCRTTARAGRPRRRGTSTAACVTRQIVAMLAQETAVHPGPAGRGRTRADGRATRMRFGIMLGTPVTRTTPANTMSQVRRLARPGHRRRTGAPGDAVTAAVAGRAAACPGPVACGGDGRGRPGIPVCALRRPWKVPRSRHLRSRSRTRSNRLAAGSAAVALPGCGPTSGAVHSTPAGRTTAAGKNFCCVTTRSRNFGLFRGLWHRLGALAARTLGLGVLGFGRYRPDAVWPAAVPPASAGPARRHSGSWQ